VKTTLSRLRAPSRSRPTVPVGPQEAAVLAAAFVILLVTRLWFVARLPCAEDAAITFRYAANWEHGLGPVYNAGERAWGFTSALWTALLAFAAFAHLPIAGTARTLLVGADVVTLVLAWRLLRSKSRLAAAGFALFYAAWPRFAQMPATGLESSLVTCLLLAAVVSVHRRSGGVLAGLLALSRPEGAVLSAIVAWRLSLRQKLVWLAVAALQVPLMLYFGRLLPSSVTSKSSVYGIHLLAGGYWLEWLAPGVAPHTADGAAFAPVAVLLLTGLVAAVADWRRAPDESPLPVLFGCGVLVFAAYFAGGVPWYYWYATAPSVAITLVAFFGLGRAGVLRWVFAPLLVVLVLSWTTAAPEVVRLQSHDAAVFTDIGRTLRADAAGRAATVMLEPIGLIGWTSGLRVIDEVGLVTPRVAAERARGDGWYARIVERERPDYLVIRRDWLEGSVAWAGRGQPFASAAQRDSTLAAYAPLRVRAAGGELPAGAAGLRVLKRVR